MVTCQLKTNILADMHQVNNKHAIISIAMVERFVIEVLKNSYISDGCVFLKIN